MLEEEMEKEVEFKKVIAAAMLKFKMLDNIDISLLLEDLRKLSIYVFDKCYLDETKEYIKIQENGYITLKDTISLDDKIEKSNTTVRDELQKMVTEDIRDYFESLDVEEFQKRKLELLKSEKKKLLKSTNILLISDIEEEYEELVRYGFTNIDYFKSIIRADCYFKKHKEEEEKYHILLVGNQKVFRNNCMDRSDFLTGIQKRNDVLTIDLNRYDYSDHMELVTYLQDFKNYRGWSMTELSYSNIFDRIVECAIINKITKNQKISEFTPIKEEINPNKIPLPMKKEHLKILYLDPISVNEDAKKIARELGLNVTFIEDNNSTFQKKVRYLLGDYDIIIASRTYSGSLIRMNEESTEQCKDTGRELVLLMTCEEKTDSFYDTEYVSHLLGYQIDLRYSFGGEVAKSLSSNKKEYKILEKKEDDDENSYKKESKTCMKAFLEEAVHIYNNALEKTNHSKLQNINFKTSDEYLSEYEMKANELKEQKERELQPIYDFNNLKSSLSYYLKNRQKGLVSSKAEGIEIEETENTIIVTNIIKGISYGTMVIKKENNLKYMKSFWIQVRTKKGNLSALEEVGVYTKKYEKKDGVPKQLNETQQGTFTSICKKVEKVIIPLNEEAFSLERAIQQGLVEKQKQKSIGRKAENRRNYNRK